MLSIPVLREPSGSEGELLLISIAVEPHLLEELLESLAEAPFPVNPQIIHRPQSTRVEFPAYSSQLSTVEHLVSDHGLISGGLTVTPMMASLSTEE